MITGLELGLDSWYRRWGEGKHRSITRSRGVTVELHIVSHDDNELCLISSFDSFIDLNAFRE
jgi:hypothetical protein